jgi:hypothetical protein
LYYISDSGQAGNLPNVEGGKDQVNNSHLIEFISATAIIDFISKPDAALETPQYFEFGAERDSSPFTIANFSSETKERCIKPLTRFAFASKIATDFIPALTDRTFYGTKELNIGNSLGIPNEYKKLLDFFEEFQKWSAVEMSSIDNGRAFNSFSFDAKDHLNTIVHGKTVKTGFLNSGLSRKKIADKLDDTEVKEPKDMPVLEKYLSMLYKTSAYCLDELGQLP